MINDVIGDIHGHAEALEALMHRMGYRETGGTYRQTGHQVVFLGDFIDRGPEQLRVLEIARHMVDAGSAVAIQGNHEFNARCWATEDTRHPGKTIRSHSAANRHQHSAFLDAVGEDSALHRETVDWFKTLPLWLDFPDFRVVHACWHSASQAILRPWLDYRGCLTEAGMQVYADRTSDVYHAGETVLKGLEIDMPEGVSYKDGYGIERTISRVKWWDRSADTYRTSAIVDADTATRIPDTLLPDDKRLDYDGAKPLFFGHYWMLGEPKLVSDHMACLDFSVAKEGWLCGYSFEGEQVLDSGKLFSVRPGVLQETTFTR